ncbi:hypothetical protein [Moraxella lacunata]
MPENRGVIGLPQGLLLGLHCRLSLCLSAGASCLESVPRHVL